MSDKRARIGIFGIGLAAYWPQFAGLRERLVAYQERLESRLAATGADARLREHDDRRVAG